MKTKYAATLITLLFIATSSAAQIGRSVHRDTPAERFPGDPVQGGALKEHRASPSSGRPANPGFEESYGSSSPQGTTQTHRTNGIDTSMLPPPVPAPEMIVQSRNGVSWLCGGIGEQEVGFMKNEARRYDMMLTFAARNGAYLADVNVVVVGPDGRELVQTQCNGPIMLVNVPGEGAYRIRAEVEGHEVTRLVQVQEGQGQRRHVVMTWPSSTGGMYSGPASSGESLHYDEESGGPMD